MVAPQTRWKLELSHLFGSGFDQVLEQQQCFVNMSPIFPVIIQSFPNHLHDFSERDNIVGKASDFGHKGATGAPVVIAGSFTYFHLRRARQNKQKHN